MASLHGTAAPACTDAMAARREREALERRPRAVTGRAAAWAPDASVRSVDLEQLERELRQRLDAVGPAPRAELLHVLMLPTSIVPTASVSSGETRRLGPSPSC
jgi:hypothetical protein